MKARTNSRGETKSQQIRRWAETTAMVQAEADRLGIGYHAALERMAAEGRLPGFEKAE